MCELRSARCYWHGKSASCICVTALVLISSSSTIIDTMCRCYIFRKRVHRPPIKTSGFKSHILSEAAEHTGNSVKTGRFSIVQLYEPALKFISENRSMRPSQFSPAVADELKYRPSTGISLHPGTMPVDFPENDLKKETPMIASAPRVFTKGDKRKIDLPGMKKAKKPGMHEMESRDNEETDSLKEDVFHEASKLEKEIRGYQNDGLLAQEPVLTSNTQVQGCSTILNKRSEDKENEVDETHEKSQPEYSFPESGILKESSERTSADIANERASAIFNRAIDFDFSQTDTILLSRATKANDKYPEMQMSLIPKGNSIPSEAGNDNGTMLALTKKASPEGLTLKHAAKCLADVERPSPVSVLDSYFHEDEHCIETNTISSLSQENLRPTFDFFLEDCSSFMGSNLPTYLLHKVQLSDFELIKDPCHFDKKQGDVCKKYYEVIDDLIETESGAFHWSQNKDMACIRGILRILEPMQVNLEMGALQCETNQEKDMITEEEEKHLHESIIKSSSQVAERRLHFDCLQELTAKNLLPFLNSHPWMPQQPLLRKKPTEERLLNELAQQLARLKSLILFQSFQ